MLTALDERLEPEAQSKAKAVDSKRALVDSWLLGGKNFCSLFGIGNISMDYCAPPAGHVKDGSNFEEKWSPKSKTMPGRNILSCFQARFHSKYHLMVSVLSCIFFKEMLLVKFFFLLKS